MVEHQYLLSIAPYQKDGVLQLKLWACHTGSKEDWPTLLRL